MSVSRRLPNSDASRSKALTQAKTKQDSISASDRFLTTPTVNRLENIQPLFKTAMHKRGIALAEQVEATKGVAQAFPLARTYVNQFIQVFNMGVVRNKYPMSSRAYYQLDVSSDSVPVLNSHQDVAFWGENIVTGDVARVDAGGEAMTNPSEAEVKAIVDEFVAKNTVQSTFKDNYDRKQEDVAALHGEADGVIKKIWDEVDTYYNEEENSSRRRKCREWGVVYVSDVEHTFNLNVKDKHSNIGIEGVEIVLIETGNTNTTGSGGSATIKSTIIEEATFRFTHDRYHPLDIIVAMPAGVTSFEVTALLEAL